MKNPTIIAGLFLSLLCLNFKDMAKITPIVGIYKITSPSGKIYIGQSYNILRRWAEYKRPSLKKQGRLINSFNKYGVQNHTFDIIFYLPTDIEKSVLDNYEIVYCDLYKSCGVELLNIRIGMNGGRLTDLAKENLRKYWTGRKTGLTMCDRLKKLHSERLKVANIGNKYGKGNTGKKHTDELKNIIRLSRRNRIYKVYKKDELLGIFNFATDAVKELNIPIASFKNILNNNIKTVSKWAGYKIKIIK